MDTSLLSPCRACPRQCKADRPGGQAGFCGLDDRIHLSWAGMHYGEEPCLGGDAGVANFFFTGCNLACVYCQNHQISQGRTGDEAMEPQALARMMVDFQRQGAAAVGLVSASHQVPQLVPALAYAKKQGLAIPVIYNTNAYDSSASLNLLHGLVDIYLPDLKYADNEVAGQYSAAPGYVEAAREAILEMFRQVGKPVFDENSGLMKKGLWVRHLVLPGGLSGTWESLCFLALELSPRIGLSVMSQYNPLHRAGEFPELSRGVTPKEYQAALAMARDLGFSRVLSQDPEDSPETAVPDFEDSEKPFKTF